MNWLAIDTAMNACGVAVRREDGQFFSHTEEMERGQAERLMPMIMDMLEVAGITLADVGAYAITVGPGTFTGLRVGLSTMRALAQVSGKPAVGVGTFDVLEDAVSKKPCCILIETKRSDYYVRAPGIEDGCLSAQDLKAIIKPDWIMAGDAVDRAKTELGLNNPSEILTSVPLDLLIARAEKSLTAGTQLPPEPIYLRGADVTVSNRKAARIV